MQCPSCGAEAPNDALFCPKCGTKVESIWQAPRISDTPQEMQTARSVGDATKLTESHSGETLDLGANNYARIIRTYRNVSRIKKIYWIGGGGAAVIMWYLGHIPWWAIPIGALLLMLLNWTLSSMTLAWLSRATGLPAHVIYGIYLGYPHTQTRY